MRTQTRILIVDDDPQVRAALVELLAGDGFETAVAENGAEAIDRLETGRSPDAIVVDLLMPGLVGQELLEYLHAEPRLAHVPIAVFSASPELAPSGYPVFKKPLEIPGLLQFLRDSCTRSAA